MNDPAIALADTVHTYLQILNHSQLNSFLVAWPAKPYQTRELATTTLPALRYLPGLVTAEETPMAALVRELVQTAAELRWGQTYTADDFGAAFLERYGWTELLGVRGPIAHSTMASGFLLLGPEIEYPKHSHEAEEIYIPLTEVEWLRGDGEWAVQPAGVPIYHRPWESHAMRTAEMPLLAIYLWRGRDLTQKSHID